MTIQSSAVNVVEDVYYYGLIVPLFTVMAPFAWWAIGVIEFVKDPSVPSTGVEWAKAGAATLLWFVGGGVFALIWMPTWLVHMGLEDKFRKQAGGSHA